MNVDKLLFIYIIHFACYYKYFTHVFQTNVLNQWSGLDIGIACWPIYFVIIFSFTMLSSVKYV